MREHRAVAALACLLVSGGALAPVASAAQRGGQAMSSLRMESLRGGMQGQSGISADLDGDGHEDLVIGAPYARGKNATGALLVYLGSRQGFPAAPSPVLEPGGNVGWSLAFLGNVPGTGRAVFATGAFSGSHAGAALSGTVTLYAGGAVPTQVAVLGGEYAMDRFGHCLAAGDLNGDGVPDLAVGAPLHSPSPAFYQRGAVYVFFGPDFKSQGRLKLPASSAFGGIGFSVAAGDVSGDGVDDLLLQATGKVLVYFGSAGSFAPAAAFPDVIFSSADAGFGNSIAVIADVSGDGVRDVAVGADQAAIRGVADSGRLFILRGGPGGRIVNADAASPDVLARIAGPPAGGRFGTALQTLAPAGGSGPPDLAVSAVHADGPAAPASGGIYVFSGDRLATRADVDSATFIPSDTPNTHLGAFMAALDGGTRLVAGAPTEDADTGGVRLVGPALLR